MKRPRFFQVAVPLGAVLFAALQFLLATLPPLWGSSEAREAHVIALMRDTGEYILPLRNGLIPSKPPLFHWIGTLMTYLTPLDAVVAARWVSSLSALAVLLMTARLAGIFSALVFPLDFLTRSRAQWLSAGLLVCSFGFIAVAVDARVDMTLAAWILAAVSAIIGEPTQSELREGIDRRTLDRRFLLFFLFAGAGCLTKGPLGLVLPALIGGVWHLSILGLRRTISLWATPRVGWALLLLIAVPWYLLAAMKGGDGFLGRQILFENVRRLLGGEFVNSQPWYFYGLVVLQISAPWSLLFIGLTGMVIVRAIDPERSPARNASREIFTFLLLWFWLGVLFFSCASGKRASYLLPLLPAQSIALALAFAGGFARLRPTAELRLLRASRAVLSVFFLVFLAAICAAELLAIPQAALLAKVPYWPPGLVPALRVIQGVAGVLLAAGVLLLPRIWRRCDYAVAAILIGCGVAIAGGTALGFTVKGAFKGFEPIAAQIRAAVPPEARITVVRDQMDEYFDPILYYLGRPVTLQAPSKFDLQCPGYVLARATWFASRPSGVSGTVTPVTTAEEWRAKIGNNSKEPLLLGHCE